VKHEGAADLKSQRRIMAEIDHAHAGLKANNSNVVEVPRVETKASPSMSARRIPELDGLRGLAILLVLICHFGYAANSAAGHRWLFYLIDAGSLSWSGVDLFFVLSGFLIGGILLDARNSPNYFKAFYTRRVFRIIPIYAVVVVAFYVCVAAGIPGRIAGSDWLFGPTVPWHAYATFTQNIQYAVGGPTSAAWLAATWSLAVEEQFYLILPAVIWFVSERWLPYVLGSAILAAPLLRVFLNLNYSHGKIASFTLMPCRADALLLGVAAAMLVRKRSIWESLKIQRRKLVSVWIVLLAGLPLFILFGAADQLQSFWMSTLGFSWLAFFYLGLLLLALIYSNSWLGGVFRNSWLKALGTISYGVYLLHWPVLGLTFMIFRHKKPWAEIPAERGLLLLALALTFAIASLSWAIIEKPLLKIGHTVKYGSEA
jgi:peptidoglycan/LPS O-acetylase OafA/YrhL